MRRRRAWRLLLLLYLALLALSTFLRAGAPDWGPPRSGQRVSTIDERAAGTGCSGTLHLAYTAWKPVRPAAGAPLLLLHGSPGDARAFARLAPRLSEERLVLAPDLPGHGASEREPCDLSIAAAARRLIAWLEDLGIARVHVAGFSLGGAVAIEMADLDPERFASLTLISATGVQELELLGDYRVNHAVHGLQLGLLWLLRAATPHMGLLDRVPVVPYARTFFESDQRPLRAALERWAGPALVLHGADDPLVPVAAALEHHRILPQSELVLLEDEDHFTVFLRPEKVGAPLARFLARVDRGTAAVRATASPERRARAAEPFDPAAVPPAHGLALLLLGSLIVLGTFVSEDLTGIVTGAMVAAGRIAFLPGTLACLAGITLGDLGLFAAGRLFGRAALGRRPFRWLLKPDRVEQARAWFDRRGLPVILLARFMPGTRLPVYFTAGLVGARTLTFAASFLLAAALWTPLLVGVSALAGRPLASWLLATGRLGLGGLLLATVLLFLALRIAAPLATRSGRRRLYGLLHRLARWEFWPAPVIYLLLAPRLARHARRAGGWTIFTAANPGMEAGGFVGESKSRTLEELERTGAPVARFRVIAADGDGAPRLALDRAVAALGGFPVVIKPDVGQRGEGVAVCRDPRAAARCLRDATGRLIVQEYVPGPEFGLFYVRMPDEESGRLFSITRKRLPVVVGDGRRTLRHLILDDARAPAMARVYFSVNAERLDTVPEAGAPVTLVELGTHCRGAIFEDGAELATPELTLAIDRISRRLDRFYFGRYDVRAESEEALRRGRGFKILELNGVTSEATHVYDPKYRLREALATLSEQWRLAYEIGRRNVERGARPAPLAELLRRAARHIAG